MKKLLTTIVTVIMIMSVIRPGVHSQARLTPTIGVVPSPTKPQSKEIVDFKEKLASQVAKLSKKNKKAVAGIVDSIDSKKFKVKTDDEGDFEVKIDPDLTKFFLITLSGKTERNISTLKNGTYVIVGGTLVDRVIEGNVIYQDEQFLADSGKIVSLSASDSSIEVVTLAKETFTLDIATATRLQIINIKTLAPERTTFAKIKEGDSVHFIVKKETKVKNRFSAVRVLIIPQEYFIK